MKRRWIIGILLVTLMVVGWWVSHEHNLRRASYQGKPVREWAAELYSGYEPRGTNAPAVAFRAMGSNAVPALLPLLQMRDTFYEQALIKYARSIPTRPRVFLFQKLKPGNAMQYRLGAIRALGVIGPEAVTALPDMLKCLQDADARVRWFTAQSITQLGPEAIAALIPLVTNTDVNIRHAAVYALGEAYTNALPAVPALIRQTLDTNENVRASAYYSLSRVGRIAVPTAAHLAVSEPDPAVRNAAFRSLVAMLPPPGRVLQSRLMISTNSPEIRRMAIQSLWFSRLTNQAALTIFEAGLHDDDPAVAELSEKILSRLNSTNRNRLAPL